MSDRRSTDRDQYFEPRCKVCKHPERQDIDIALARQSSYVRIGEDFDLPYRSVANHRRKHVNFEQPTIKLVVEEEEAIANEIREIGVELAIKQRVMLDTCIQVAVAALAQASDPH